MLRVVVWCHTLLYCGLLRAARCLLCHALCYCCVLCRVSHRVVRLPCWRCGLPCGFVVRCCVLWCAVYLGAVLRRVAPPSVVLFCAVLFCFACLVPLLAVSGPRALSVALAFYTFRRSVLWCFAVLCALCCVGVAVVWWCVLLFAAVVGAVVVLRCLAVRSMSSLLCVVLCCAMLVRLRCAVRVVCAVSGARCCGALMCVVLLTVVCCGAVPGMAIRGCLLVACFGVGVPVSPRGLLPCR